MLVASYFSLSHSIVYDLLFKLLISCARDVNNAVVAIVTDNKSQEGICLLLVQLGNWLIEETSM